MKIAIAGMCLFALACAPRAIGPADVRLGEDACAQCRMTLVAITTSAQIVEPGEEPVIFDEIGCLRDYLAAYQVHPTARIFVADHRTGSWIEASAAVFTRTRMDTPMASGLLAHADAASRDDDPAAAGGTPMAAASILQQRMAVP